jgi:methyl-accepting chemotaxis protein
MDHMTRQNAAMVEQSTTSIRSLASEAQELSRLVAQFNVEPQATSERGPRETLVAA